MDIFGSSGVRGVALDELTPATAIDIAQAAGSLFTAESDHVAVGRDSRQTGQLLVNAVASGLASVGCTVNRVGVVPTPALQSYCEREGMPGVMVTASHNPAEYNGIKLCGGDGVELDRDRLEAVESRLGAEDRLVSWNDAGDDVVVDGVRRQYREEVLAAVDRERIANGDLTVAIDPGHGAGALTSPDLFTDLGCSVTTINAQPDGTFPGRRPEPVEDSLDDLGRLVRSADADIGIAHDGDADRAVFFDETGAFVEGDVALAVLAARELEAGDTMVSAVNCSQRLVDVAEETGANLHLTPIGSTNLISTIRELQADGATVPIAGEGNGGIIFPDFRIARDGAYTAARFCELVAEHSVSELAREFDGYANVRYDVGYEDADDRSRMLDAIESRAAESDASIDTTDGYRFEYEDGWVLARPSGTEPVFRVYAEARSEDRAETLAGRLYDAIEDAVDS
jgi:phosphomannomutase/phosphoglucomutase